MRQARRIVAGLALVAVCLAGASHEAAKPGIKQLMGENFAGLQTILVSLITANYASVPAQTDLIRDHAAQLTRMIPESAQSDPETFLKYALALKIHAESLQSISEILMQHDREKLPGGRLATDHLREALAAHYGGMVTTCVGCHNRFRQKMVGS